MGFATVAIPPPLTMNANLRPVSATPARRHLYIMHADLRPTALRALWSLPTMLADGCPAALLALRPILVMLAFPYLSIPDGYLSSLVKIFPSLDPLRLLHRLTRDELFRLARHCHHKPAHGAIDSDGFY